MYTFNAYIILADHCNRIHPIWFWPTNIWNWLIWAPAVQSRRQWLCNVHEMQFCLQLFFSRTTDYCHKLLMEKMKRVLWNLESVFQSNYFFVFLVFLSLPWQGQGQPCCHCPPPLPFLTKELFKPGPKWRHCSKICSIQKPKGLPVQMSL